MNSDVFAAILNSFQKMFFDKWHFYNVSHNGVGSFVYTDEALGQICFNVHVFMKNLKFLRFHK